MVDTARADQTGETAAPRPRGHWALVLAISLVATVAFAVPAWWWTSTPPSPSYAVGANHFVIRMTDYSFSPERMVWHAGDRVTLTFINQSQAHPGRNHEFMMGRQPMRERTPFGITYLDGFEEDFFSGIGVALSRTDKAEMVMPGQADLSGPDANKPFVMGGGADMGGMDMGGSPSPGTTATPMATMSAPGGGATATSPTRSPGAAGMPGMSASPRPGMSGMTAEPSGGSMPSMSGMSENAGFMVELLADGVSTIGFVVPDKPGTWEYGCFSQTGQHYANGMRGEVTIV